MSPHSRTENTIAARLVNQRRIGGNPIKQAGGRKILNFSEFRRVDEKFHGMPLRIEFPCRLPMKQTRGLRRRRVVGTFYRMAPSDATSSLPTLTDSAVRITVLLPLGIDTVYDYLTADAANAPEGAFVRVPLASRMVTGVVWRHVTDEDEPRLTHDKLKHIGEILPVPVMTKSLRKLIDWVAEYTLAKRGAVLRMAMSVPEALEPPMMRVA